ncbi:hypothetical protein MTO96_017608 [Rhipicephalus appendiculatus]
MSSMTSTTTGSTNTTGLVHKEQMRLRTPDTGTPGAIDLTHGKKSLPTTKAVAKHDEVSETTMAAEDTTSRQRSSTVPKKKVLGAYPLLCTYGMQTNGSTLFPEDGLCDLIFFDSAYKDNQNVLSLPSSFGDNMKAFLAAATSYRVTDFGVAFAYEYRIALRADLTATNPVPLEVFWKKGIGDFGIIDMPAFDVEENDIHDTFATLKELNAVAKQKPDAARPPYIVLGGALRLPPHVYASEMRDMFSPTLLINHGHYAFADSDVPFCAVVPPTMRLHVQNYPYNIITAVSVLQSLSYEDVSAKLLLSVGMKGRSTTALPGEPALPGGRCLHDVKAKAFRSYVEVCTDAFWSTQLKYDTLRYDAYTFDASERKWFIFDDEYAICEKICRMREAYTFPVRYGIAVYDLEYEDYSNKCSWLNKFGAFSRVKMSRKIVEYFSNYDVNDFPHCEREVPSDFKDRDSNWENSADAGRSKQSRNGECGHTSSSDTCTGATSRATATASAYQTAQGLPVATSTDRTNAADHCRHRRDD